MIDLGRAVGASDRSTSDLLRHLKEAGEPIVVSINGKASSVVSDDRSFRLLLEMAERLETLAGIRAGLDDMKAGKGRAAEDVLVEIGRRHGVLPDA